jgi:ubiquinone/menaquinone biosynthesis C-methylase UbiE
VEYAYMPPVELIAANGIGMIEREDQEKARMQFHNIGHGLIREMQHFGYIKPTDHVLDVGCGLGRLARPLVGHFTSGSYTGMDVVKSSIDWCRETYAMLPNFRFQHADVTNTHYNKHAQFKASDFVFPFTRETFDFQWSTSLFTHLLIETADNYLGQMARVLKRGGTSWNTWALLDDVSEPLAREHPANMRMRNPVDGGLVSNPANPEHLIGFYTDRLKDLYAKHGLKIVEIRNGPWSGRTDNLRASFQDVILAVKA